MKSEDLKPHSLLPHEHLEAQLQKVEISHSMPRRRKPSKESREPSTSWRRRRHSLNDDGTQQNQAEEDLKQLDSPYKICCTSPSEHSFGLSKSLSTESVRRACGFYDEELSDDDLIEVQEVPADFQKHSSIRKSLKSSRFNNTRKRDKETKEQLIGSPTSSVEDTFYSPKDEEAICVLNELDAVLDKHETYSLNTSNDEDTKIEDCLLDLDSYLEQMDDSLSSNDKEDVQHSRANSLQKRSRADHKTRTLPLNNKTRAINDPRCVNGLELERGDQLRQTISYAQPKSIITDSDTGTSHLPSDSDFTASWRRNSMRQTDLLPLKTHNCTQENCATHITYAGKKKGNANNVEYMPTVDSAHPHNSTHEADSFCGRCGGELPTTSQSDLRHSRSQRLPSSSCDQTLTHDNILQNLVLQNQNNAYATFADRPRQLGRRMQGYPLVLSSLDMSSGADSSNLNGCILLSHDTNQRRPFSAPATGRVTTNAASDVVASSPESHSALYIESEASTTHTTRNNSPISIVSSSDSVSTITSTNNGQTEANLVIVGDSLPPLNTHLDPDPHRANQLGINSEWSHSFSRTLALVCCTLGLFNICRFAVLTIHYGGNFVLQFLLLSILFGIPLFWLQMCLGAKIKSGPVSMWKISPICRGIGIALIIVHCLMAIYSTVVVGWVLTCLQDAFQGNGSLIYRWQDEAYSLTGGPEKLGESVGNYFNLNVLQRLQFLGTKDESADAARFRVNERLAFNLAVIWSAVFLILCKGLKSYGKMLFILGILPLITSIVFMVKLLYVVDPNKLQNIFTAADFDDFLINSKTWTAAAQETFLTWGLLGASVIAITSRTSMRRNNKNALRRDAILTVFITLFGLAIASMLGLCCLQVLTKNSYVYVPGSYEHVGSYVAIYSLKDASSTNAISFPPKWVPHYSSFVGEIYRRPAMLHHPDRESGYQALRFISELFPAVVILLKDEISWIWIAVALTCFTLFGLAQLCAMWKPISSALGNSTSSVLLSCVTGLLLTIPFATEVGVSILHYMDLVLGGAWFIPLLWTAQIFGVFLIRGRPYNGDDLVNDLKMSGSMSAFLALSWNVLLPIGLITLAIIDYKTSQSSQFYYWRGKSYFSYWARKVAGLTQVGFLLLVPVTALVQIYRYLANGPPDILDRIQLLYRPPMDENGHRRRNDIERNNGGDNNGMLSEGGGAGGRNQDLNTHHMQEDAPPKYTPPPSYTTATGARLAKLFRQSIRRSVRRILGEPHRSRPTLPIDTELNQQQSLPPNYTAVLTSPSVTLDTSSTQIVTEAIEIGERLRPVAVGSGTSTQYSLSLGRKPQKSKSKSSQRRPASAPRNLQTISHMQQLQQRPYTAEDVVAVLRSSMRLRQHELADLRAAQELHVDATHCRDRSHRSVENLILNAEPLGQSPAMHLDSTAQNSRTVGEEENNVSVI